MSNGDTLRKSHVVRLYQGDDPESEQWIDMERLDELTFTSGRAEQFRRKVWTFNWDEFNPDGANVIKKKIYDPNDEENFIEIPVRKSVLVKEARGEQYQRYRHHFVNDVTNQVRKTISRRVYHHEVKEGYLQGGAPPSDPNTYLESLGDQDMEQYVEVELLDQYWTDQNENRNAQGRLKEPAWQLKKWVLTEADPLLKQPMLETDEVDPKFIPVRNPDAGPRVDPPWRIDPLQNIVNVSWAVGSIGVAGNERTGAGGDFDFIYRCKMTKGTKHPEWKQVAQYIPSSEPGALTGFEWGRGCVVYASVGADADGKGGNPTFVAGGRWGGNIGHPARISISHDGKNWIDVYTSSGSGAVYGVCWDATAKAFYAAAFDDSEADDAEPGETVSLYDVLLRSTNGTSWGEVYRAQYSGTDFVLPPGYTNPIVDHGGDKVTDSSGKKVTNAFWGYNEATDTLIYPDPPYNYWGGSGPGTGLSIKRGGEISALALDMDLVWAVTFAGGIWHACGQVGSEVGGGSGRVATSVDDGVTWTTTFEGTEGNPIRSIAAGPTTDF